MWTGHCVSVTQMPAAATPAPTFGTTAGADTTSARPPTARPSAAASNYTAVGLPCPRLCHGTASTAYLAPGGATDILAASTAYSFVQGATTTLRDRLPSGQRLRRRAPVGGLFGKTPTGHDTFLRPAELQRVSGTGYAVYAVGFHPDADMPAAAIHYLATSANVNEPMSATPSYRFRSGNGYLAYALGFAHVQALCRNAGSTAYW